MRAILLLSRIQRRAAAATCGAALLLQVAAPAARAATLNWAAAASGAIGTAANWNPVQVPTASDFLRFDVGPGPYTVTCGAAVPSVVSHEYRQGIVHLQCLHPHFIDSQLTVGAGAGQAVTTRLESGILQSGWNMLVGTGAGADGTLQVIGGDSNLLQNPGPATVFIVGGASATGTLRVASGGEVQAAKDLDVGFHAGSLGTVRVIGESNGPIAGPSTLLALSSTAGTMRLGPDSGHGVLEVSNGGWVSVNHLVLAENAGDVADVTLSGAGALDDSRIDVSGDLRMGANTAGGSAAGTATVTLAGGSSIDVAGTTTIGDLDGGTVTFTMQPGSRFTTHDLAVLRVTALDGVSGGLLQVDGGAVTAGISGLHLAGGSGAPELQFLNGATGSLASLSPVPSLVVGDDSSAVVSLLDGSSLSTSGGRGVLGRLAGSNGNLRVQENSVFGSGARLDVGDAGEGQIDVWSGAQASAGGVAIARIAGSSGRVTVVDQRSTLTVTDRFDVGGTSASAGGDGDAQVALGGRLALQKTGVSGRVWPGSSISVWDLASLDLAGSLEVQGHLTVANASVSGGTVTLLSGGLLSANGEVASSVSTGTDTTTRITATGLLDLGSAAGGTTFTNRGLLEVGPHLVRLRSSGTQPIGNVTLAGGTLELDHAGTLEAGKRLTGTGTVKGQLVSLGDIVASGPAGLAIAGDLEGTGTGIGGTLLRLTSSGDFSGGGRMDLPVIADAGSGILLGSDLVMGRAGTAGAVQLAGTITIGPHLLELRSATEAVLSGIVSIQGGTLRLAGGGPRVRIASGAALAGSGTVDAPLAQDGFLVLMASATPTTVAGAFTCSPTSVTTLQILDGDAGSFGRLEATGALALDGVLDLHYTGSWRPGPGDSLQVLAGASRAGQFSSLRFEGLPWAGEYAVHYKPDGVWLVFGSLVAVGDPPPPALPAALTFAAGGSPGPGVSLDLALPAAAEVRLEVFDVHGRRAATLHDGSLGAGWHRFDVRGARLDAGVYYARASTTTHEGTETRVARFVTVR